MKYPLVELRFFLRVIGAGSKHSKERPFERSGEQSLAPWSQSFCDPPRF